MKLSASELNMILSSLLFIPFIIALVVVWLRGALKDTENAKYLAVIDPDPDLWAKSYREPPLVGGETTEESHGDGE